MATPYLSAFATADGWQGYGNGKMPADKLCRVAPGQKLRCDAAAAYGELAAAYQADFHKVLCITDSYRPYRAQVDLLRRKPTLAAFPGTSNHGWRLAVDLCDGINDFGTPQYRWMSVHAAAYGWVHPGWAREGGSRQEPWHWEFAGDSLR
ncbi:hypothetical protein GCM10009554_66430 [Kribbella koreensis]|uniref:D-alanyl-D-alanine carboxypeptidase-like core domain-containing protein n=1 Tax=Kribbella koreensis TaxID=57909 RepID=A0ABN1RG86_9ACTN